MEFLKNYMNNIRQTPKDYYRGLTQATIDWQWTNTTQLYTIKEQSALPFTDEYTDYEAWIDVVSDNMINTSKVYSDFVRVLFKDIDHKQNYKGQYYKIALDREHEEYYICYDRMGTLDQVADFSCVRCNNVLTWINEYGKIVTMPCYLGTDITSTNNLVSKDGSVPNSRMIILVQANDYTMSIVKNQRFMFQHSTAFKVEEVNNYMQEEGTDGQVTCVRIYVDYSAILPSDNKDLNICDYYDTDYSLTIDQGNLELTQGATGTLTATVKNKDEVVQVPVEWFTSDLSVVEIDEQGNYHVVGENGSTAQISCYMLENDTIKDTIEIKVVEIQTQDRKIVVVPYVSEAYEGDIINFECNVYDNGVRQDENIDCIATGVDSSCYDLRKLPNGYQLEILSQSDKDLILTFNAEGCNDVVMNITLYGLL